MSNFDENTKAVNEDQELENAENDVNQDLVAEPEVLETTGWQDVKNGFAGVWTGIKKGAKKHKLKIIGGAAGVAVVAAAYLKGKAEKEPEIDTVETTETPLIEAEPEPEYPEVCGFMYDKDMNEHVFNSKEEALDALNSIVPDEEPVKEPTDNNVEVGPEVTE